MQKLLKIFILLFIANNAYSQFVSKPSATPFYDSDFKFNGKVKSITIRYKKLYTDNKAFQNNTDWEMVSKHNANNRHSVNEYREDGNISAMYGYDSANNLQVQTLLIYDSLNRLVEKKRKSKNGITRTIETYKYDSLNRWISTCFYDTLDKPFQFHFIKYKADTVITSYSDTSFGYTVYTHKNNINTIETYLGNGKLYYKSQEVISEKTKIKTEMHYNTNGQKWNIQISKSNEKESYSKWKNTEKDEFTEYTSKKNETGDEIEFTTIIPATRKNKLNKITTIKREYVYDSNGNFISKISYYNDQPTYKTIREIEYY